MGEAEDAFPPERLAAQQAQVMRRLEALERPARVIAFPRFARPVTSSQGHAQRWVAAAAAGVIGLAAGCSSMSGTSSRPSDVIASHLAERPAGNAQALVAAVGRACIRSSWFRRSPAAGADQTHLGAALDAPVDGRHHAARTDLVGRGSLAATTIPSRSSSGAST
jgi:hypothetical protein